MRRHFGRYLWLAITWAGIAVGATGQNLHGVKASIKLMRVAFETGLTYGDPVATVTLTCVPEDLTLSIDWADGEPSELLQTNEMPQNTPYHFFTTHKYAQPGTYKAVVNLFARCMHSSERIDTKADYAIRAFERVPIEQFSTGTPNVGRGSKARLSVKLVSAAPPSGTRVFLAAEKPGAAIGGSPPPLRVPSFIEILPGLRSAEFTVQIPQDVASGTLGISALGGDGIHTVFIRIR